MRYTINKCASLAQIIIIKIPAFMSIHNIFQCSYFAQIEVRGNVNDSSHCGVQRRKCYLQENEAQYLGMLRFFSKCVV